jgi:multidrug efflux pump subunit AcrB
MSKPRHGLIGWFITNHVAANILMLLFVLGGLISLSAMQTETFPPIDPKLITINVTYPGATPYEVADAITSRAEEALVGIEGIKRINSTAAEGHASINVELLDFVDADEVYNDVETAINALQDFPPEDANRPIISKVRLTPNVITLALHGNVPESALRYWGLQIEEELRALPKVALTTLRGVREAFISIEVSEQALQQYGLSFEQVNAAIANASKDIPAGTIESRQGDWLFRVQDKRRFGPEFENIVVLANENGASVRLKDIGRVIDGLSDRNLISRFNGERAAYIDVLRSETDDTLELAEEVKSYLAGLSLPNGLTMSLEEDETIALSDRMSLMLRNGILGFMLVFLILLLFLDLKLAFWTSAAIPISFLGGLMIIHFLGFSLNMITLFALIVVLGIVVDDGIIIGESIFDAQEKEPNDNEALTKGVFAVISPVTVGVATTIAAFAPLIFSTGTLGQIVRVIPIVVISILIVSLIEAYFILPAHLSSHRQWSVGPLAKLRNTFQARLRYFIQYRLLPMAAWCIQWRYVTIAFFIAIMILTIGLVKSGIVRFIFFPTIEGDKVTITVSMPIGTPFSVTERTMTEIEETVEGIRYELNQDREEDIFESIGISIGETVNGRGGPGGSIVSSGANHLGQVRIKMVPSDFRNITAMELERQIRERIQDIPNIDTLEFKSSLVSNQPDIEIELTHTDESLLQRSAETLRSALTRLSGTKDVLESFEYGKPEYIFAVNDQGYAVGLTPASLGQQLRNAFFGFEVQRFQRGTSEVLVYARYPKDEREQLATIHSMRIHLPNGQTAPLSSVADIQQQRSFHSIETVDGRRILKVTADADRSLVTPDEIIATIEKEIMPSLLRDNPGLQYSFEGKTREQRDDLASLSRNMMIALLIMYMLLGAQLKSYIQPIAIMSAIPFGIVGAILGHWLLGYDLSFISLFGVVALAGVVVNDSIVLVDNLNLHHRSGQTMTQSALLAIERRFRPILLTTLSTSLGLLPMLMETSIQARFLIPMVVSLAFGILFATIIVVILIPCLMVATEDVARLCRQRTTTPEES